MTDPSLIPAWRDGVLSPVDKMQVHLEGLPHRAVSVFVFHDGALLIQQRAVGKYHTPGLWANTCCTHPIWGEPDLACAERRLDEELGIGGLDLEDLGEVEYRADVGNGMVEHEHVRLFRASPVVAPVITLNPDEVAGTRWVTLDTLREEIAQTPERFTPWLRIYLSDHAARILP
ncbi:MAG: isopentenyl-diphosphate delta-isomerase [Rhodobacterales bacterium]|nr:MAG: isopentenyl-diphosphate delta-isomerase [Rhodobacterales bacterium]